MRGATLNERTFIQLAWKRDEFLAKVHSYRPEPYHRLRREGRRLCLDDLISDDPGKCGRTFRGGVPNGPGSSF